MHLDTRLHSPIQELPFSFTFELRNNLSASQSQVVESERFHHRSRVSVLLF
ncbi:hypothetical protein LINPERHAP2_LOCUS24424 [Linum perenne]